MHEDRLIAAFGRLDRALARVEQAPRPADRALAARHQRLRAATRQAVADLDALIAGAR